MLHSTQILVSSNKVTDHLANSHVNNTLSFSEYKKAHTGMDIQNGHSNSYQGAVRDGEITLDSPLY